MNQYEIFQSEAFPGELVAEQPSGAFETEFGEFGEFEDEAFGEFEDEEVRRGGGARPGAGGRGRPAGGRMAGGQAGRAGGGRTAGGRRPVGGQPVGRRLAARRKPMQLAQRIPRPSAETSAAAPAVAGQTRAVAGRRDIRLRRRAVFDAVGPRRRREDRSMCAGCRIA